MTTNEQLTPLRRRRRRLNFAAVASRLSVGVANIDATIEPFASQWDDWNRQAMQADGPLWVALGDSVTQGIGASSPRSGYPPRVLQRLRERTGEPWRLINLSMSGGRFEDVVESQLVVLHDAGLRPDAVSAVIGSNDVIWRRNTSRIVADAARLVESLPTGTVLSRVSEVKGDRRRRGVNRVFDAAEAAGKVRLYEAWDWPTGRGMWAEDNFHPNDAAYGHLADNLLTAFEQYRIVK